MLTHLIFKFSRSCSLEYVVDTPKRRAQSRSKAVIKFRDIALRLSLLTVPKINQPPNGTQRKHIAFYGPTARNIIE